MPVTIPVDEDARNSLRLYKVLSGASDYSDAITSLMEEAGYSVPEGGFTEEEVKARVFGK